MNGDIWAQRYWGYTRTYYEYEIGQLLGIASSVEELERQFGDNIDIWDAKERDWL